MLETLASVGEFVGGIAVLATLIYLAFQLNETRKQMRANTLQSRIELRIQTWLHGLDSNALNSARSKVFEHEIYKLDVSVHDIEEFTLDEKRAYLRWHDIETLYFSNLFYQRKHGLIEASQTLPLDLMQHYRQAPMRYYWKHEMRDYAMYEADYIAHVDKVVHTYDEIEIQMNEDQDAEYNQLMLEYFDIKSPPDW